MGPPVCDTWGLPEGSHAQLVAADDDGMRDREDMLADVRDRFGLEVPLDDLVGAYHVDYPRSSRSPILPAPRCGGSGPRAGRSRSSPTGRNTRNASWR